MWNLCARRFGLSLHHIPLQKFEGEAEKEKEKEEPEGEPAQSDSPEERAAAKLTAHLVDSEDESPRRSHVMISDLQTQAQNEDT